jgi:hypothetical protein
VAQFPPPPDRASLFPDLPQIDADIHLVLCDFGKLGRAYVETDPDHADEATTVRSILEGQYDRPLRVIAFNPIEGWCRDVSEDIARAVLQAAPDGVMNAGTRHFVEEHTGYLISTPDG